jgi:hypothetical protein
MSDKFYLIMVVALLSAFVIISAPSSSYAATLVWDPSRGVVDGYIVYWGTNRDNPSNSIDVGPRAAYHLDNLPLSEGLTYYISVSAYNSAGESPRCAPVVFAPGDNTPPSPPQGLRAD